jgi:hypothetical protein
MTGIPLADRILLTEPEAAAMLGMSGRELGRLRLSGSVRCVSGLGQLVRYSPDVLRRWAVERSGYADANSPPRV